MAEQVIKITDMFRVSIDDSVGYTIRFLRIQGAVYSIDKHLNVSVGQSSRITYTKEEYEALFLELQEGFKFMTKVNLSGGVLPVIRKKAKISSKDLKKNTLYQDEKGRYILYLGEGDFKSGIGNLDKGKVVYGIYNFNSYSKSAVPELSISSDGLTLLCYYGDFRFGHYVGKPKGIIKEIMSFPSSISQIGMVSRISNNIMSYIDY